MKRFSVKTDDGKYDLLLKTSKEDILEEVDKYRRIVTEVSHNDTVRSAAFYNTALSMLDDFKTGVQKLVLFNDLEDAWEYVVQISSNSITLCLEHIGELLDMASYGPIMDYDQEYILYEHKGKLLTVEEFSKRNNVDAATTRQWIRRGKIRTAQKRGNEWRIPELTERPNRGYNSGAYRWEEKQLIGLPEQYEFFNNHNFVSIIQDPSDKKRYMADFTGTEYYDTGDEKYITRLMLTDKMKEKLELYLIANPQISYVPSAMEGLNGILADYCRMERRPAMKSQGENRKKLE